ncbi:MAG TPA: dihydroorotase [Ktedonobacterales bacterium]|nr:dihydroorotase [Ktedonobacterales bacterium]
MTHDDANTGQAILLRGARVVDPSQGIDGPAAILIANGRIAGIGSEGADGALAEARARLEADGREVRVIDLPSGWVVAPGFVDLHTHLREPGYEAKETIASGARAAARGGFTTICCMPNTQPVIDTRATLDFVRHAATGADARVRPIAAISKGEAGRELSEMAELAEAGAVAFSDDGRPVSSSRLMRSALSYAAPLGLPVVEHCQDDDLVGDGVMNEGPMATLLGLKGWPAAGETITLARDLELVRATGARYHAAHLSVAGAVELVRAAKRAGLPVTAEVTPHHLLLTDAWVAGERTGPLSDALTTLRGETPTAGDRYDTNTKVNPPLRSAADCDALLGGLLDGTIDAIATDHAPHTIVDKDCEYGEAAFGISGFETALAALLALVHTARLPLATLVAALSERPARAWGLDAGTLQPGALADLVIFDPDEWWTVDPTRFASKGKNTPLAGLTLRGRVRQTWLGGRQVYDAADETANDAADETANEKEGHIGIK